MAERAHRPAETKKATKRRRTRVGRHSAGKLSAVKSAASTDLGNAKRPRAGRAKAADPNADSAYFQHLSSLAAKADRGETVDSTGMSGEDFLTAFLRR